MKKPLIATICLFLTIQAPPASAATVTASAGETICNQTVGNALNVVAYRSSSQYCVVEFKNVGTTTWTVPSGVTSITYLVVAGGGGGAGGQASEHGGGGGGAGGVLSGTLNVSSGIVNVSVGGGGTGGIANNAGTSGSNSSLAGTVTAIGGGRGGTYFSGRGGPAIGGSGGGAGVSELSSYITGADGTAGQGNKGGNVSFTSTNARHGAGGGGAGGVGGNTVTSGSYTITAGAGGIGVTSSITGTATYFGGGGGGGGSSAAGGSATAGASGGNGGGGNGASWTGSSTTQPTAGSSNTGGGGGGGIGTGGGSATVGGAGGSGIVIVRYLLAPAMSVAPTISGTAGYAQTLSATSGTWSNSPASYTYQWSRAATSNGTYSNIAGATASTYTTVTADVSQFLKVTVTASNSGGSSASTSTATAAIARTAVGATISLQAGALVYRQPKTVTATATVAGKITFRANGKKVPGCIGRSVSSLNAYVTTCSFKPATRGLVTISTVFEPTDTSYVGSTASTERLFVSNRGGSR